ncbi:MAG: TonB C-terminal domain-containing protein [Betaproteobacteria bacterium]|nr:TonB C-terminal domain-containing protein [Betaproteobacteria bacterium]
MSAAALQQRPEPGKIPAFFLAALVHAGFVAVLVFGVSWQTKAPIPLAAELWSSLPTIPAPEPPPPAPEPDPPTVEPKPEPPKPEPVKVEPPQPTKAEIELKKKIEKDKEKAEKQKQEKALAEKKKREADEKKRKEDEKRLAEEKARKAQEAKAKAEADAAARAAATRQQKLLDDWANQIRGLIRSRANVPDSVTGAPEIQVRLKLLVTGAVFEAVVVKRSGNGVYDDSIERAIAGIRQWPTPADPDVFRNNREITLNIKHEK